MSESKTKKKRPSPTKFTDRDLEVLTTEFATNQSPRSSRITALATQLSYTDQGITSWFSNRRKKVEEEEAKKAKKEEAKEAADLAK